MSNLLSADHQSKCDLYVINDFILSSGSHALKLSFKAFIGKMQFFHIRYRTSWPAEPELIPFVGSEGSVSIVEIDMWWSL